MSNIVEVDINLCRSFGCRKRHKNGDSFSWTKSIKMKQKQDEEAQRIKKCTSNEGLDDKSMRIMSPTLSDRLLDENKQIIRRLQCERRVEAHKLAPIRKSLEINQHFAMAQLPETIKKQSSSPACHIVDCAKKIIELPNDGNSDQSNELSLRAQLRPPNLTCSKPVHCLSGRQIISNQGSEVNSTGENKKKEKSSQCKLGNLVILSLALALIMLCQVKLNPSGQIIGQVNGYQLANNLIANNLPPKFATSSLGQASNSEIVVRVKEGLSSIGKLIYTLKGEDPDEDTLTFGVLGSTGSDLLRIENAPGNQANVYLRKELDRETTESYQVVITLTDGKLGRGNWITKSMLIIVEDVNDNYPVFGPHRTAISIRENARAPLVIETLEATDQDEGRFGQVVYKLEELTTSAPPTTTTSAQAADESGPGRPAASSVFSIETVDGKGVISLIGALDYEQKPLYQLRVIAVDRATESERLSASTSILISVEDCEDQPPMFTFVPSITRIPESLPVGSPIVRLAAIDGDRGINNPIQFKLISVNGQERGSERDLFAINEELGQISVARELDREAGMDSGAIRSASLAGSQPAQPGSYVLQVRASEIGSSARQEQTQVSTELTIILTDVNDESPTFNQEAYFGELLENSTPENLVTLLVGNTSEQPPAATNEHLMTLGGSSQQQQQQQPIVVAKVVDRDQGTNGTFTLHLEGEHSNLFEVWPREATNEANFMVKVSSGLESSARQLLDFERNKLFQLNVVAREKFGAQSRSNSAQLSIYLRDANDNYPQFESELYRAEIPENAQRGMQVCTVRAIDADSGLYGSQGVRYTEIRGEKANKFKLDPLTGVVSLKTNEHGFDRETIGQHHLIIEARDNNGSGNRNTTQLLIILTDVNDQRPKFQLDQYEAFIYENELDFQSPLQVQAIDNDAQNTQNSRITYSIVGGDPQQNFTIDPQTGRIRVRPLAKANGIYHEDSNQAAANQSGLIGGLDFEQIAQRRDDTRQFNLTIKATDAGLPEPLSGFARVIVLVYDKNDHAPIFTRQVYSKSVREDAKEGSQVLQVLAQDGDHSPTNSRITYRISSGASDKFAIDSDSGLISVASGANLDIDRAGGEKKTNYLLNVIAFDGSFGPNQKSASALVNISILDVNNKPPEFVSLGASWRASSKEELSALRGASIGANQVAASNYAGQQQQQPMVVNVNEDAPYGLVVTRVVAIDLDSSAELRYSINWARSEARNEDMVLVDPVLIKDLFSIEPTDGTIKVSRQLDRELFDQVKLRLQVEDIAAQTQDQIANAYLLIKITDINDNRPAFKKQIYKAVVNENSISGTSIITLTADDRDLNKTLRYSLDGPNEMLRLVRINPRSGEVTVNDKIDRELYSLINVTVRAEDSGYPHPLMGMSQLLVTVRDENDNNPMFLNATSIQSSSSYADNLPKNHAIDTLSVPTINNRSVSFRLRSLAAHKLDLAGANQALIANSDRQSSSISGLPFLAPGAQAKVREDAQLGEQVAYVRAEDADIGNNGRVTYLMESASSGGKFRIDRDSGIISVAGALDRELVSRYSLIIEACDNYDLGYATGESRRVFTQVNILITDTNDNAPIIIKNSLQQQNVAGESAQPQAGSPAPISASSSNPTYEDLINSPGPYEVPMQDCLFITEFQPLNEPILTLIATDADDPNTLGGQVELAIVNNNLPQKELFGLIRVKATGAQLGDQQATSSSQPITTTNQPSTTGDNNISGFGDLNLDESSQVMNQQQQQQQQQPFGGARRLAKRSLDARANYLTGNLYSPVGARLPISHRQQRQIRARESPMEEGTTTIMPANQRPARLINSAAAQQQQVGEPQMQAHLVVTQSLKEKVGNYSILIRASDKGQPRALSSIKQINICVQDVNNHAPVFIRPQLNHTIRIIENATIGSQVVQVEATDSDFGSNGELQYSLKQTTSAHNGDSDWQAFKIDRLSGIISTAIKFNRQVKKYYTLRVEAQDLGRPTSLSSDIDISIMIVNSGQYQPEFDAQQQVLQFTENIAPGIEWFTLNPTTNLDDDPALINYPPVGQPSDSQLTASQRQAANWLATPCYFIVDGDDREQVFHLDRYTHKLTNQRALDRESKANYTLLVQATNNCNQAPAAPVYSSRVLEANSSASPAEPASTMATPSPPAIDYRSSDGAQAGARRFVRSPAPAEPAKLVGDNSLPEAGAITDADQFNQAAANALLVSDRTLLKVLIRVKDVNDNAPKFTQRVYTGGITTEADFGTIFMIAQANDADADANGQITYSIVKPIKRYLVTPSSSNQSSAAIGGGSNSSQAKQKQLIRQRRALAPQVGLAKAALVAQVDDETSNLNAANLENDIPMNDGDDLFVINPQTGEISLNFDPQKHMKGYFEFEIMANDTDGLFDSARVLIYLLRQDQRVKFVLRLAPQELRQRLNKFRSVFGNITGAIVNIDSYKYFENHDGTVDKKKTSLYLHFVNPDDNSIIDVDKVLTLIDNNIEYLDELYKEFYVLSSEAAHLPLSSSALIDPIDQIRTGLLGITSFLALILVLVIALCLNQRTRYERQLKAATVSAFGGSPLHLDPDFHGQTNLPNTNLHSQDPNPIWMNGYGEQQEWLSQPPMKKCALPLAANQHQLDAGSKQLDNLAHHHNRHSHHHHQDQDQHQLDDADYLSSENSDLVSLSGRLNYNAATTATPRDSLNSSQGRTSGSGSGSNSTTNDRQALCSSQANTDKGASQAAMQTHGRQVRANQQTPLPAAASSNTLKRRSQAIGDQANTHSTFGAFKEVTIYTADHHQQRQFLHKPQQQQQQQLPTPANNLIKTVGSQQQTSQVNKIASQFNARHQLIGGQKNHESSRISQNQIYITNTPTTIANEHQPAENYRAGNNNNNQQQQRILVHANGADVNRGIIKATIQTGDGRFAAANNLQTATADSVNKTITQSQTTNNTSANGNKTIAGLKQLIAGDISNQLAYSQQQSVAAEDIDSNLNKLSILNLETTEL